MKKLGHFKFHIFWEGHKILGNLHQLFDCQYIGQITGGDFARPSQNIWTLKDKQKVVQNYLALPPPPSPPRLRLPPPPPGLFWGWHSLMGLPSSRLQAIWVRGFPRALYLEGTIKKIQGFKAWFLVSGTSWTVKFIRYFQQSQIPNIQFFLMNYSFILISSN